MIPSHVWSILFVARLILDDGWSIGQVYLCSLATRVSTRPALKFIAFLDLFAEYMHVNSSYCDHSNLVYSIR